MTTKSCWGSQPPGRANAEIVAEAAWGADNDTPQGHIQLAWAAEDGDQRLVDVVGWRRLDLGPWRLGQEFEATVQARPGRDLRLPLVSRSLRLRFTFDPRDTAEILVGDLRRLGGWRYGLRLTGVIPASRRRLPLRPPSI